MAKNKEKHFPKAYIESVSPDGLPHWDVETEGRVTPVEPTGFVDTTPKSLGEYNNKFPSYDDHRRKTGREVSKLEEQARRRLVEAGKLEPRSAIWNKQTSPSDLGREVYIDTVAEDGSHKLAVGNRKQAESSPEPTGYVTNDPDATVAARTLADYGSKLRADAYAARKQSDIEKKESKNKLIRKAKALGAAATIALTVGIGGAIASGTPDAHPNSAPANPSDQNDPNYRHNPDSPINPRHQGL